MKNSVVGFFRGKVLTVLCFSAVLLIMSACLDDDDSNIQPIPVGYVNVYHAAPDAPALDIVVDGNRINAAPFDYADHSGYLNFYTGNRNLKFKTTNAANALVDTTLSVAEGKAYSLFVINTLPSLELLIVGDSADAPAAGKAMVRFVNLSPDSPAITVAEQGGSALFEDAVFKDATNFIEVDAKKYSFDVKSAENDEVLVNVKDVNIREGGFYTIITRGFANPPQGNTNILSVEVL